MMAAKLFLFVLPFHQSNIKNWFYKNKYEILSISLTHVCLLSFLFKSVDKFYLTKTLNSASSLHSTNKILYSYLKFSFFFFINFRLLENNTKMGMGSYDEIGSSTDPHQHLKFTAAAIASQVVGFIMVILSGCWMGIYHGGYGWDISVVFNYHPLFMTMGMIFLYGDGKAYFK